MILTDIEGTISSISFVKKVLFPYARINLPEYLKNHFQDNEIQKIYNETQRLCEKKLNFDDFLNTLTTWIDEDKKATPLKTLQGYIWEDGFKNNVFKSHFYPDAIDKIKLWSNEGFPIFVYSSGSIFAQKLFFSYTEQGNLLSLFSGHFDTTIGSKKDPASYAKIAEITGYKPEGILFLSDITEELDAASATGLKTVLINREGVKNLGNHAEFSDFNNIDLKKIN